MCNNKNKHSGGVSWSACNVFIIVKAKDDRLIHFASQQLGYNQAIPIKRRSQTKLMFSEPKTVKCHSRLFIYLSYDTEVKMKKKKERKKLK